MTSQAGRKIPPVLWTLLTITVLTISGAARAELSHADAQRAERALFAGDDLREEGRCEEAIRVWRGALRWSGHWTFVTRIARCYESLGRYEEAITYLQRARPMAWDEFEEVNRAEFDEVYARIRAQVPAQLDISANATAARISVDGEIAGTLPLRAPLELEPGTHLVELSADGYQDDWREISVTAGTLAFASFTLRRDESQNDGAGNGANSRRRNRWRLWSILFAGVGVALAGVGGWLISLDEERSGQRAYDTLGIGIATTSLGIGLVAGALAILIRPPGDDVGGGE